jgi:hypothetical protein
MPKTDRQVSSIDVAMFIDRANIPGKANAYRME